MKSMVQPTLARGLAVALLVQFGAPLDHAAQQSDVLIEAELRGHPSHGLL
ncbi:MAG: hypothetical protein JWQ22_2150, partial [Devosia sp.]|nr:hypothetical protein [Devosia sp.]